jgi:transposase
LRFDPCFELFLAASSEGDRSNRHGVTESNPALAFARSDADPGDRAAHWLVAEQIRKYLRSGSVEPQFRVPERSSKLDPFAEKLSHWLRIEAGKSRKQRRTVKQLHADLVALGFDGSYGRIAAFARAWKAQRQYEQQTSGRGTFVPLVFAPGEEFQFDWSKDWAVIAGERMKLQAAPTKLAHSKAFIVRAYPLQTHEMLFDAVTQAFRALGGVPRRGIFDNMKTAVDKVGAGKLRQVNACFAALASHYLFEPDTKALRC